MVDMRFLGFTIPGLAPISEFFAKILQFFNSFTGSFGWNVILLTIAFRVVVLPLSIKQTKSMIAMQRLQPQLKEIQKKYKDDREKQGQEMMKLYKDNKVSPLGGCLPLLLQLPILFALFEVLRDAPKYIHYKTSFAFMGISNLVATGKTLWTGGKVFMPIVLAPGQHMSKAVLDKGKLTVVPGHEYAAVIILILLTIVTGYISSKMMTNDPKQAKMMALMPVIFGVFAWILPAGVTLYIITTNVLMVIQQYIQLEAEGFYDEKMAMRLKTGDPLKWHERWRFKGYDVGSAALTAVRIKRPEKLAEKRAAASAKPGKPEAGGKSAAKGAAPPKGAGGKSAKVPAGKKTAGKSGGPPAKKTAGKPGAPPQKKAAGKPGAQKNPGQKPAGAKQARKPRQENEARPPEKAQNVESEAESDTTRASETAVEPSAKQQAAKPAQAKQYPAKKKGSRKK